MAWYNESWTKRVKVTIDNTKVSATLSDFPVYIDLSELPADFHTNCNQTDARDIRVTTSDEVTEVPREVVAYNSATDTGELHFKAPSLSSSADTDFYIYYSNAGATEPASDATYGRNAVWSDYKAVYHMKDDPTGTVVDSSGNTPFDANVDLDSADLTTGKIGAGIKKDTGEYFRNATGVSIPSSSDFTFQSWMYPTGKGAGANPGIWRAGNLSTGTEAFCILNGTSRRPWIRWATTDILKPTTGYQIPENEWTLQHWVVDSGSAVDFYANGSSQHTATHAKTTSAFTINNFGWQYSLTEEVLGTYDEVRFRASVLTSTWISTEYNNQSAPSTFSTIGTAEDAPVAEDWYNASWDYRVKITVQSSQVDATLTDFPVYVDLSDLPAGFHTNVNQTDGRDIRVTKADGLTELPREVVLYDSSTDTGELHFKADSLSSSANTEFYIYYGNSSATEPAVDATYGAENVWDSNFKAVYHLQADPSGTAPQLLDSTSNSNDLTSGGSMTSGDSVAVKMGKGIDLDGTDDELLSANNIGITGAGNRTVSAWVKQPTASNKNFLGFGTTTTGGCFDMLFHTNKVAVHCYGGGYDNISNAPSYTANTLVHAYAIYNGTSVNSFVNGTGGTATNMTLNTANSVLKIGKGTYSALDRLTGQIDEVRVSDTVRSTDWMSAEYTNQATPTTFYSVGTQEEPSAGGTSADSEKGLYIQGKSTSSSTASLYIEGVGISENSERGLYVSGYSTSNAERGLYIAGSQILSTDYFNVEFGLAEAGDSEVGLYIWGSVDTGSSERSLYLGVVNEGTSERSLYLTGYLDGDSERSLYLQGKTTGSSERALYTEVVNTGGSARNMYVPVDGGNYSDRFMYLSGKDTGSSERGLYVTGGYDDSSERSLYLEVVSTGTSERSLYVGVVDTDSSERSLYLIGSIDDSGERSLYLTGVLDDSSERNLYLAGGLPGESERNLYLGVVGTGSSERSLHLGVVNEGTSERSLYVAGSLDSSSERSLYLSSKGTSSSDRSLYLTGSTTDSGERSLYLDVVNTGDSQRGLYITGCLSDNSERTLYLSVNQVGSSERGMWLHGGMVGDAEVYFWDGMSWVEITALTVYT
jgi:hypothetical protein